jgi:uncharacterized membrane protein YfcA
VLISLNWGVFSITNKKDDIKAESYLLKGVFIGAGFGFLGSFASGFYFWSLEHPDAEIYAWLIIACYVFIFFFTWFNVKRLDKLSRKR